MTHWSRWYDHVCRVMPIWPLVIWAWHFGLVRWVWPSVLTVFFYLCSQINCIFWDYEIMWKPLAQLLSVDLSSAQSALWQLFSEMQSTLNLPALLRYFALHTLGNCTITQYTPCYILNRHSFITLSCSLSLIASAVAITVVAVCWSTASTWLVHASLMRRINQLTKDIFCFPNL